MQVSEVPDPRIEQPADAIIKITATAAQHVADGEVGEIAPCLLRPFDASAQ